MQHCERVGRRWLCRSVSEIVLPAAAAVLILFSGVAYAGDWVYPQASIRDETGAVVYPTSDGRRFGSAMEREAYLRSTSEVLRNRTRAVQNAARREQAQAVTPRIALPRAPVQDLRDDRIRTERLRAAERQRVEGLRIRRFLEQGRQSGAEGIRADLAGARADRQQRVADGIDRLYSGAFVARKSLGQREQRPIGPLIRAPRIGD